jgi:nucleoside-diphosphate-sugar epimerase
MAAGKTSTDLRRVLVTGGSGFVGQAVIPVLDAGGWGVCSASRRPDASLAGETIAVPDLSAKTDWTEALKDCQAVVHLAGKAHILEASDHAAERAYFGVNAEATRRLAERAAAAGVERFVFVSTAKVHGEGRDAPYSEADPPAPENAYARSKWLAEQYLAEIGRAGAMQIVVLRPPLIYGRRVKANFLRMLGSVARGIPLPLAGISNRRSLLYAGNLADAILVSLTHKSAGGQVFLVSDGQDLSTPELWLRLAQAMGVKSRLWSFPPHILEAGARLVGRKRDAERLLGSFTVDSTAIRQTLGWMPPYTIDEGLIETAGWFRGVAGKS